MKNLITKVAVVSFAFFIAVPGPGFSAESETPGKILITNVSVWDGTADSATSANVLIVGDKIEKVGSGMSSEGAIVINGKGGDDSVAVRR